MIPNNKYGIQIKAAHQDPYASASLTPTRTKHVQTFARLAQQSARPFTLWSRVRATRQAMASKLALAHVVQRHHSSPTPNACGPGPPSGARMSALAIANVLPICSGNAGTQPKHATNSAPPRPGVESGPSARQAEMPTSMLARDNQGALTLDCKHEPAVGFEPTTSRLLSGCSTN